MHAADGRLHGKTTTAASSSRADGTEENNRDRRDDRADCSAVPTAVRGEPAPRDAEDRVTIRMPAEGAYLSVLRTATQASRPASISPWTRSRTCGSPWTRHAACCSARPCRGPPWTAISPSARTVTIAVSALTLRAQLPARRPSPGPCSGAGRKRGRLGRAGQQTHGHAAQDPRAVEVRVTEEIEVRVPRKVDARVADEIDATVAADIEAQVATRRWPR